MKNKKLLLLIPLLVACGGTSTPSVSEEPSLSESESFSSEEVVTLDLSSTLEKLSKGVKLEVKLHESYSGVENDYLLVNTSKDKEFSFIEYKEDKKLLHEYFASLEDDYIYQTRLNVENSYNYYKVYNPMTSDFYKWSEGYDNEFDTFVIDDFSKVSDINYALKEDKLNEHSSYLSTLLYGNPGLDVTSFNIYLEEESLKISASAEFVGVDTYNYTIDASVISLGEDVEVDYRDVPYSNVEDPVFEKMLNDLKSNNYTALIFNSDGVEESEAYYLSNEDKVYYEVNEYKSGFYVNADNLVQEVEKVGEDFYKVGAPLEGDIKEVMPTFNLSRAVFDKVDNVYTLKNGVEGDMSTFVVLETYADSLDVLEIKVTDNGYEVKNVYGELSTTVQFINIGSTDVGFSSETVLEPVEKTTWESVLDEESYNLLVDIAGDYSSLIPVPEGYQTWYQLSEEPEYVFFAAEAGSTIDDDIYAYSLALLDAGFIISEEEGMNGGVMGLMEVTIDGVTSVLVVEFLEYEGLFSILVYLGE